METGNLATTINLSSVYDSYKLKIKKLYADSIEPTRAHKDDSGLDLYSHDDNIVLYPGQWKLIDTGIAIKLPTINLLKLGYSNKEISIKLEAQIRSRSGLANKHGIMVLNSPGTLDNAYIGPVKVVLMNLGDNKFVINRGDRIAQLVISPVVTDIETTIVTELEPTDRGENGFGSTGK